MKLEKRTAESKPAAETPASPPPATGGKPVILYIMVMFIVAFLLMALSMMMHQRTTAEGIGELQHSFSAMQELQANQEKVIDLQDQLTVANLTNERLKDQLDELKQQLNAADSAQTALLQLLQLQNAYQAEDYPLCADLLAALDASDLPDGEDFQDCLTAYETIKADVESRLSTDVVE